MKRLWAPWRTAYIRGAIQGRDSGCFLCGCRGTPKRDRSNLVLLRGRACFVVLNRFPYNVGHLMIAPYAHKAKLAGLDDAERAELLALAARLQEALDRAFKCDGHNLGINVGRVAGAGLPGHLHLHLVPRWSGDTNFMPVVGETKVMPIGLDEVYRTLARELRRK
jgi:ATP adenylyltransferase